ncbi:hypothetical protein MIND_01204600 [Mycena indigotica]|uniref:Uncharacterized protein n=1 Tax=Mycena indigotica TaxID=2126181 RepID=A0A8H6S759_9AGAR|nr:uncharacterized protein MIND_01204600 [Mycena indigotica]KAF7293052.1 hypothetical protein MIND_01204600 [Mycena indigotica]
MSHIQSWAYIPPLDSPFPDDGELDFLRSQTGIENIQELKQHVSEIQAEAYKIYPYPCIRGFDFLKARILRIPAYTQALNLLKGSSDAIYLEVGACFGVDVRKVHADGVPADNIVATELFTELWEIGHKLFKSTQATFPITFIPGDLFDEAFLSSQFQVLSQPRPDLPARSITSLSPLRGNVSVIHISYVFHVLSKERQIILVHKLASLLSPAPGSMILGCQLGANQEGHHVFFQDRSEAARLAGGITSFCYTEESWRRLWEGAFPAGTVQVNTHLDTGDTAGVISSLGEASEEEGVLVWSVTRL